MRSGVKTRLMTTGSVRGYDMFCTLACVLQSLLPQWRLYPPSALVVVDPHMEQNRLRLFQSSIDLRVGEAGGGGEGEGDGEGLGTRAHWP